MAKSSKLKSTKKRVNVKDLPAAGKKMTGKEMKKVKGGTFVMQDVLVSSVTAKKPR